ncbi:titin [Caerostris extrusa]|uniref:Titin n=1 Tax=Caerostris extrusa TaxID=172846 RepID=A0AAV4TEP3_CAEEX|nr:titin [Caerostris extrusa]
METWLLLRILMIFIYAICFSTRHRENHRMKIEILTFNFLELQKIVFFIVYLIQDSYSKYVYNQVQKLLKLNLFHFSGELKLGLRTGVICIVVDGDPPFDFKWLKNGIPVQEKTGLSIRLVDEFTSMLTIKSLEADSNGNYTCRVSNSAGWDEKSDVLNMKDTSAPKIKPFHFSGELREGLRSNVMCTVIDGVPPFHFQWSKDGGPLMQEKVIFLCNPSMNLRLFLPSRSNSESNGNYTCRVTNSAGSDEIRCPQHER